MKKSMLALIMAALCPFASAGVSIAGMSEPFISLVDLRPDDAIAPGYTTQPEYLDIWQPRSRAYDFDVGDGESTYVSEYLVTARSGSRGSQGSTFSDLQTNAFLLSPYTTFRLEAAASIFTETLAGERAYTSASISILDWYSRGELSSTTDEIFHNFTTPRSELTTDRLVVEFSTGANPGLFTWISNVSVTTVAAPVPEPETYALMLAGLGLVGWRARRRSKSRVDRTG